MGFRSFDGREPVAANNQPFARPYEHKWKLRLKSLPTLFQVIGWILFADFSRDGETVALNPKAFDVLVVLVENRDRVLAKSELLDAVWKDQFVEENNLAVQI